MEYLQDLSFLKQICKMHNQEISARIILLNFNETPKEEITGKVTDGTINLDGASTMQRTCSLSLTINKLIFPRINWTLESKVKIDIGLKNTTNQYTNYKVIWFPMGIYYLTNLSINETATAYTISLQGKDKMCQLSGDIGGIFNSSIDFGKMDIVNEKNEIITKQIPISTIIKELVHTYGNELYNKILIYDLEDYAIKLMSYRGKNPLYVLLNANAENRFSIINYIKNANYKIYDADKKAIELGNINEENLFVTQYNLLGEENSYTIFYIDKNKTQPIYVKRCAYGDIIGYVLTDLIYGGDLIAAPGETVKSILDKIKNKLGIYEYFYDVNGNFVFKKQDQYAQINSYLNPNISYMKPSYSFINNELNISNSYTYDLNNIKNDFTIWGQRAAASGDSKIDIHMRVALDEKPLQYISIYIDEERANYLINNYEDFYPLLTNETEEERLDRLQQSSICYRSSSSGYREEYIDNEFYNIIKYVDWREIIYQMAQDYKKYNYIDEFPKWLEEANPIYTYGKTGYERYYTDIDGFWRTLYQIDFEKVNNQESLSSIYNYRIKGVPTTLKNKSGLLIQRNTQIAKAFYPNGYPVTWAVLNNTDIWNGYECLLMLYQYQIGGIHKSQTLTLNGQSIEASTVAHLLQKIENSLSIDDILDNGVDWSGTYILTNTKTNKQIKYEMPSNYESILTQWIDIDNLILNNNHLIIWALAYNLLYDNNDRLITSIDSLITDTQYYIRPLFLSLDPNIYSTDKADIRRIEKNLEELIHNTIINKGFKGFITTKPQTFRILSQNFQNIILEKNYNTKMAEDDFPVYNRVLNDESGEWEYQYVGTCQSVIDNNYRILKKLYWFAANGDDEKDYLICKHLDTGIINSKINSTALIRLLNFDFKEVPNRFEYFHNTSWLQFLYNQNKTDYNSFEDQETIYYDLTHLYKIYSNNKITYSESQELIENTDQIKRINTIDEISTESIYIPIKNYPKNSYGDDLTNVKDFSKDINQLFLWAQAYNILYKQNKDIDINTHYNKNIIQDPTNLIFWFDFLDTTTFSQQYSIQRIGPRELVKRESAVSVIEYLQYLDNIFLDYNEEVSKNEEKIKNFFNSTFSAVRPEMQVFRLGELDNDLLVLAQRGTAAAEFINNYIYNHVYMTQGINISAIPQYFLTPNSLMEMINSKDQLIEKYVINKITFSLRNGGAMSIQASKMLPEVLEKQDVRKEIING